MGNRVLSHHVDGVSGKAVDEDDEVRLATASRRERCPLSGTGRSRSYDLNGRSAARLVFDLNGPAEWRVWATTEFEADTHVSAAAAIYCVAIELSSSADH